MARRGRARLESAAAIVLLLWAAVDAEGGGLGRLGAGGGRWTPSSGFADSFGEIAFGGRKSTVRWPLAGDCGRGGVLVAQSDENFGGEGDWRGPWWDNRGSWGNAGSAQVGAS
eukprot:evm.model.scf_2237.3 EVM.evm.TU.scf_2237.3   scf_2237:16157-16495(-)